MPTRSFQAETDQRRLDQFLANLLPELSRSRIQALIRGGAVTIDGKPARASQEMAAGATATIVIPDPEPAAPQPESIPLDVLYEDDDILVIDKPAGMVVHPAPGHASGTLVNAVLAVAPDIDAGDSDRPGIVHRLDRDTSGVMVIARNPTAYAQLVEQFGGREVDKTYVALVAGDLRPDRGAIEAPVGRDARNRQRMAVTTRGKPARTEYTVVERLPGLTLVEAHPITGRTHQLRVHFASIGHHVVGDPIYGRAADGLDRQFLHARDLAFTLPSGERRSFTAPLPEPLAQYLQSLRPPAEES